MDKIFLKTDCGIVLNVKISLMMGHNTTFTPKNKYGGSKMAAKNVYPVKMKPLLLYNDMTHSGVYIFRNVEKSRGELI
jgi:hypothetical protein